MKGINILGYLGGTIIASSMPLQVYQAYSNGSTSDISWKWLTGYITGLTLIFCYAQLERLPPVWGPLCLEISSTLVLICLKIKYDVIDHRVYSCEIATQTDDNLLLIGDPSSDLEFGRHIDTSHNGDSDSANWIEINKSSTLGGQSELGKSGYRTVYVTEGDEQKV